MHYYNQELINAMKDALADETAAVAFYWELAEKAPNNDLRRVILGIRRDEQNHALKLREFLTYMTGTLYTGDINIKEGEVKDFKNGVKDAIKDEEEAAVAYKKIMDMTMQQPMIYYTIAAIRKDEQLHAKLFKTMLD